jgi:hypothetical protein
VLSWDINADWQYDPALNTEIEVRFIPDGEKRTRIELEHRRLDRYGARRDEMRRIYDTEGDWGKLLEAFAGVAASVIGQRAVLPNNIRTSRGRKRPNLVYTVLKSTSDKWLIYYRLTLIPDQLASSVEGPEKAGVGGSIPSLATI